MTKVNERQSLPALDNSKSVKNPDLLNIADKNYASTILRYSNLAILYSQLDTKDKHIVGAINEINKKVQPAKKVGETDVVGGVIVGDGIDVNEEGVISVTSTTGIKSYIFTIYSNDWDRYNDAYVTIPSIDWLPHYHILVQPQGSLDYNNIEDEYYSCGVTVEVDDTNARLKFHATLAIPSHAMRICVSYWRDNTNGSLASTIYSGKLGERECTIYSGAWDSSHIATLRISDVGGRSLVTASSEQVIMPLLPTSAANIENNLALQAANLCDAGQDEDYIYLYAENIPNRNLKVRILFNG